MPGQDPVDQCPFCSAPWGECRHALLLAEWEADALAREAQSDQGDIEASGETRERGAAKPGSDAGAANASGSQI